MTFPEFLLILVPLIGWGIGDIFGVVASRKIGSYLTTFYQFLFGIILTTPLLPFFLGDFDRITTNLLVLNVLIGTAYVLANFFVNEGFKQSSAPIVGVIIQSFPALVLILSNLIFKDPVSPSEAVWIVLVFTGVFLCSVDLKQLARGYTFDKGIRYAIAATTTFAVYFTVFRVFSNRYGWFLPNYISFLTLPFALYLARIIIREKSGLAVPKQPKVLFITLISALLIRSGDIALNLSVSSGLASIAAPLAGAAPVIFVIASAIIFKDKITKQQTFGIIITLLGITGLSFFG